MLVDHTNGQISQHKNLLLYCDGACEPVNPGGVCGTGWVIFDADSNQRLAEESRFVREGDKLSTNNTAEYCALGFALRWLLDQNWKGQLRVRTDSALVVNQVLKLWACRAPHLQKMLARVHELLDLLQLQPLSPEGFLDFTPENKQPCVLEWIRRELNAEADALSKKACETRFKETGKKWPSQYKKL